MTDAEDGRPAFDEQAALAELERLREQIVHLRSKRVAASVEFDRFVSSLKTGETAVKPAATSTAPAAIAPNPVPNVADTKVSEPLPPPADRGVAVAAAAPAVRRPPGTRNVVLVGALLLLAAGGVVTWTLRKGSREATEPDRIVAAPPPSAAKTDPPSTAAQPIEPSPYDSQITTTRPAWVRVVADGQRVIERELPAQARVPFRATSRVVVRAGDAGAVRLFIGGRDQGPLGADGVVVTRTFSVPQTSAR